MSPSRYCAMSWRDDAEFRQRFQTEAQAVAMLSHPNIVSVYDVSHTEDVEYIVMELIEGVTLMQYMQKEWRARLEGGAALLQYRSPRR